jgi:hypothetical protein
MNELMMMVPLLVLGLLSMFPIIGCVGEDPEQAYDRGKEETKKALDEEHQKEKATEAAQKEAEKYENVVLNEPHLVSYWRLSEGPVGSLTAEDSVPGMPKPGQYKNAAAGVARDVSGALYVPNPSDKAALFDGIQGYVEIPHDLLINPVLEFTIEAWIRPAGPTPQPQVVLGSYEVDAAGKLIRGFALHVFADSAGAPRIRARVGNGTVPTAIEASLEGGTEHDGWRHVVVTYSVADKSLKLYVNSDNGTPDAEMPAPGDAPVFYVPSQSSPWRIAAGQTELPAPALTASQFFKGRIDEVALYNGPLDGASVKHHFLRGIALPS